MTIETSIASVVTASRPRHRRSLPARGTRGRHRLTSVGWLCRLTPPSRRGLQRGPQRRRFRELSWRSHTVYPIDQFAGSAASLTASWRRPHDRRGSSPWWRRPGRSSRLAGNPDRRGGHPAFARETCRVTRWWCTRPHQLAKAMTPAEGATGASRWPSADFCVASPTTRPRRPGRGEWRPIHTGFDDPARNAKIHKIPTPPGFSRTPTTVSGQRRVDRRPLPLSRPAGRSTCVPRGATDIAVFQHSRRTCSLPGSERLPASSGLDEPGRIWEQVCRYTQEGFPANAAGLAECPVVLRRHTTRAVRAFDEAWWDEIMRGSRRDQDQLPRTWRRGSSGFPTPRSREGSRSQRAVPAGTATPPSSRAWPAGWSGARSASRVGRRAACRKTGLRLWARRSRRGQRRRPRGPRPRTRPPRSEPRGDRVARVSCGASSGRSDGHRGTGRPTGVLALTDSAPPRGPATPRRPRPRRDRYRARPGPRATLLGLGGLRSGARALSRYH